MVRAACFLGIAQLLGCAGVEPADPGALAEAAACDDPMEPPTTCSARVFSVAWYNRTLGTVNGEMESDPIERSDDRPLDCHELCEAAAKAVIPAARADALLNLTQVSSLLPPATAYTPVVCTSIDIVQVRTTGECKDGVDLLKLEEVVTNNLSTSFVPERGCSIP